MPNKASLAKDGDPNACPLFCGNRSDVILLPCGHPFCQCCIFKLADTEFKKNSPPKCPNCRIAIDNVTQVFLSSGTDAVSTKTDKPGPLPD